MNTSIPKVDFKEAVKLLDTGYYIMHLSWQLEQSPEIYRQNRDCSHFLVKAGQDWRNPKNPIVLVIADPEAEKKYMGSRAGTEKYGDRDRTYEELIIENQLLKKAVRVFLHDLGSPLSYFRNQIPNMEYWVKQYDKEADNSKYFERVLKIGKGLIRNINTIIKFHKVLWRAVDRRNPPNNEQLQVVIADLEKLLSEDWEANKDKEI